MKLTLNIFTVGAFLLIALLSISFEYAFASCESPEPIFDDYKKFTNADVVFIGTVTDVYNPHPETHPGYNEYDVIAFDVKRVLKGSIDDGRVTTNHDSSGYLGFDVGDSYLVYAFGHRLEVNQCTSPILLDDNDDSLILYYDIMHNLPFVVLFLIVGMIPIFAVWRKKSSNKL